MTEKMFWDDPYLTQLVTHVTGLDDAAVTLAQTIFFAFSGGQEGDHGSIGGRRVVQAEKQGHEIVYTLEGHHDLRRGNAVEVVIDWVRRYRLMRLHFAAEIVLELAYQNLEGITKIGAHIAEDKARIDFDWHENIARFFPLLEEQSRALIDADHAITSAFSDPAAERRYWEVPGFARVPCGGTHLRRTGEVGAIRFKRRNVGKNKERIEIYLAD